MQSASEPPVDDAGRRPSSCAAGEQGLVTVPSMVSVLELLPDEAFENLLVVTVRSPRYVEEVVRRRGHDPCSVGVVPVTSTAFHYEGDLWVTKRVGSSDMTGISIETARGAQFLTAGEGWFVFDNVHALLMYNDDARLLRLLDSLATQFREADVRGAYAIVPETVDGYGRFQSLFDVELDCR